MNECNDTGEGIYWQRGTEKGQVDRLLPCPWCGETPIARDEGDCFMFICPEGSACRRTKMFVCIEGDRETAIKRWNTRAR